MKVQDLDVLRPEKKVVKIGGKEVDVSFVPCGITFDIDEIVTEIMQLDRVEVMKGGDVAKKAFMLSVRLCATFCKYKYPELDEDWWMNEASPVQLRHFSESVQDALRQAYAGIENPPKAARKTRKSA